MCLELNSFIRQGEQLRNREHVVLDRFSKFEMGKIQWLLLVNL